MRTSLTGVDLATLPTLPRSTTMPADIPGADAELPSLVDDLPGRAVMVVHPEITTLNAAVSGWSDLELLFFGVDGRWRRLSMEELGLPDSELYSDTYAAGALSEDGRWWAGPVSSGLVALDLATGETRLLPTRVPYGTPRWVSGRHSILADGEEIAVTGATRKRRPYTAAQVGFAPDGTPLSLVRSTEGEAVLVEWQGNTRHERTVAEGISPPRRPIAAGDGGVLAADRAWAVDATRARFAVTQLSEDGAGAIVVTDSNTGERLAELTGPSLDAGRLFEHQWLDGRTLLIVAAPYFVAWRPASGDLFRVTDARTLRDSLWAVSVATRAR